MTECPRAAHFPVFVHHRMSNRFSVYYWHMIQFSSQIFSTLVYPILSKMLVYLMKHNLKQVQSKLFVKPLSTITNKDFFGIKDVTSKEIAGTLSGFKPRQEELETKYRYLTIARNSLANEELKHDAEFGKIRFDEENRPQKHGQFEPINESKMFETTDIKQNYVPSNPEMKLNADQIETNEVPQDEACPLGNAPYRMADVTSEMSFSEVLRLFKKINPLEDIGKYSNQPPLAFYFESAVAEERIEDEKVPTSVGFDEDHRDKVEKLTGKFDEDESENGDSSSFESPEEYLREKLSPKMSRRIIFEPDSEEPELLSKEFFEERDNDFENMKEFEFDKKLDEKYDHLTAERSKVKMRAVDHLKMVRSKKVEPSIKKLKERLETEQAYSFKPFIKLDSLGFNDYTYQVPNFKACRHVEILNYIKSSIVYNNYDIIAVNKPYGIASHEEDKSRESIDMNSLVSEVAAQMRIEKVYLAHRLDKTTSGILLFATSQKRAANLNKLFKSDQIKKAYWCITRGVPDPEQAIIDIPIAEYKVAGKSRSCLAPEEAPDSKQLSKRFREARRAITEYRVMNATKHAALVECKPRTGVKHQIRCHLSFGINRPILGDHKYSHIGKLAPQTLTMPLLNALHMRQQKVRTLPMHLHAKSIVIPGAKANGETLFIHAPVPLYFKQNLKTLGLMNDDIRAMADD